MFKDIKENINIVRKKWRKKGTTKKGKINVTAKYLELEKSIQYLTPNVMLCFFYKPPKIYTSKQGSASSEH